MKRLTLAAAALASALSLPAFGQDSGAPVSMADDGLRQWVQTMPTDTAVSNDLFRVIKECDCPPGLERTKAFVVYFDGLFHHHGYSYSASVREYMEAVRGLGDYRYERTNLIPESGIAEFVSPAVGMIREGYGAWLTDNWMMTPEDVAAIERMISETQ